ncbi:TenA family protein [Nesterenkonia sphaerica]|uniref:TenA family protein n=1 Tax=Nesterenkonia sphaerica TaxID=1804988 RepID=A0A5R9A5U3_9MICC|nr:TenA family protein [Nesterenkonia sphaerica]TLP74052.1 TenA family protein [Nesterenkonia sphaerica]
MTLFQRLKKAADDEWAAYTHHDFVRQLEAGTLPPEAFRNYLIQDYLFLIQFARAYALAAYKGRTLADVTQGLRGLSASVEETELHVRLCARWGISREDMEATPEHPATVAYTRYVLDAGNRGDLLDLHVALAPCVVGYAEIGARLQPVLDDHPDHPYAEWIAEYASEQSQQLAADAVAELDSLGARFLPEARFGEVAETFATATRMESAFWQMGLELADAER